MNDNLSDVFNLEHAVAGVVGELLVLIVHGLLMCGSSYKVELASKGDAPRDDGSCLFIKIEELNDSLINLLLDPAEVILKPANKGNMPLLTGPPSCFSPEITFGSGCWTPQNLAGRPRHSTALLLPQQSNLRSHRAWALHSFTSAGVRRLPNWTKDY